jgi:hypothetical protein
VLGISFFDAASQAQGLTRRWTLEDVLAQAPFRLYRATVSQHWVLDPDSSPDDRPRSRCDASGAVGGVHAALVGSQHFRDA